MSHLLTYSQTLALEAVAFRVRDLDARARQLEDEIEQRERELAKVAQARDEVQRVFLERLGGELGGVQMPETLDELKVEQQGEQLAVSWEAPVPAAPVPPEAPPIEAEAPKKKSSRRG